jgi:phosphopantetheinyl transferase
MVTIYIRDFSFNIWGSGDVVWVVVFDASSIGADLKNMSDVAFIRDMACGASTDL